MLTKRLLLCPVAVSLALALPAPQAHAGWRQKLKIGAYSTAAGLSLSGGVTALNIAVPNAGKLIVHHIGSLSHTAVDQAAGLSQLVVHQAAGLSHLAINRLVEFTTSSNDHAAMSLGVVVGLATAAVWAGGPRIVRFFKRKRGHDESADKATTKVEKVLAQTSDENIEENQNNLESDVVPQN